VQLTPRRWPALVRAGLPFGLISLALTITFSIDTVILSRFVSAREVGWYNVAYNLVRSLVGFLSAFSMAMVPSLSRTYVREAAQVERWYYRSVKFILLVSLPLAVGGMLSAFPMVRFLYTPDYKPSALALQILIWDVPLLMFTAFCGNMTTVISAEHTAARIYGLSAVANVALNLYAIPKFGMVGASLVTLLTDLVAALQFYVLLRHRLHMPNMTSTLLRLGLASAALGAVLWLAGDRQFLLLLGLGGVAYAILVLVLRLLDAEDWALLRRLWPFRNKALREGV
jgi:O-antigen/teichoic acid export membrane protein